MIAKIDNNEVNTNNLGNKGKFLIEMKKEGFNVPSGIVLDSEIYEEIIKFNNIREPVDDLLNEISAESINKKSVKIQSLFNNIIIPYELINEIKSYLDKDKKYAVRSSGIKEDLEDFSFAGQYDTFLNVNVDEIENNIISCYKSMFSPVILAYLVNNNISLNDLKMSIVIQEMVNSEYSGVCFTVNPSTGNDKEMLIEVSEGLGENIVSGKTIPEQYSYDWYNKKAKVNSSNKILSAKQVKTFGNIFADIAHYFGYPCDIEFAIENNQLYILQARKITKIKYNGIKDMWSTADFKDGGVSATICTPYMWSLYEYIWEYASRKFITESKILKANELPPKMGEMFYSRCYWNMSAVKKVMSKVIGYKEREFDAEYGISGNYEGDGNVTKVSPKSIADIIKIVLAQNELLKSRLNNAQNYKNDLLEKYYYYKDKFDSGKLDDIEKVWLELTENIYLQSESTYFMQIYINTVHQSIYKDSLLKYVSESDYLSLLGSIDNISHLLPFYDMWELSRKIKNSSSARNYWINTKAEQVVNDLNSDNYYLKEASEIINKYGYHSDKELDITYPCYYEQKHILLEVIKEMVELDDSFSPLEDKKKGTLQYKEILNKIKQNVSKSKYDKIEKKVNKMRTMLWWREEFRDISTRFYYILRIYTLEYAKLLKSRNIIDDIEDIWFLKVENLWDYISEKCDENNLRDIILKNKFYYESYRNYMSENEIGSTLSKVCSFNNKNEDFSIKGLGANNGITTGTARVITDFSEIDRLQENDILITKFTDTGWTSKFAILSGIVTEYGGILCHAAIVSREYGIPAIVCCTNAMSKIKDGQVITINGTTGEIKIEK